MTHVRSFWIEIFGFLIKETLQIGCRLNKTPTGDDVVRFISRLPSHLQSRHTDGKIAWSVVKNAETQLDRSLTFRYPDFKLSRRDGLRIDNTIQELLDDGHITKDPVRQKQWLTCEVIKRLVAAAASDAVQNGTKCWDTMVAGAFALVIQGAFTCRSRNFRRSAHYKGKEYLKWEEIELVAIQENSMIRLRMLVTLFWQKGLKRDHSQPGEIELGQLEDSDSIVNPTKLRLAYALRIGAVEEIPDSLSRAVSTYRWHVIRL